MDTRIHDALHALTELQRLVDRLKKLIEEMVKEDASK